MEDCPRDPWQAQTVAFCFPKRRASSRNSPRARVSLRPFKGTGAPGLVGTTNCVAAQIEGCDGRRFVGGGVCGLEGHRAPIGDYPARRCCDSRMDHKSVDMPFRGHRRAILLYGRRTLGDGVGHSSEWDVWAMRRGRQVESGLTMSHVSDDRQTLYKRNKHPVYNILVDIMVII